MTTPFGPEFGCACATTVELAHAALIGEQLAPRCSLHQADEIEEHKREQGRRAFAARIAREDTLAEAAYDRHFGPKPEPSPPECSCNLRGDVVAAFRGAEVPACAVHRPTVTPANPDNVVDLNTALGSDALTHALARAFGASIDEGTQPPEAA